LSLSKEATPLIKPQFHFKMGGLTAVRVITFNANDFELRTISVISWYTMVVTFIGGGKQSPRRKPTVGRYVA